MTTLSHCQRTRRQRPRSPLLRRKLPPLPSLRLPNPQPPSPPLRRRPQVHPRLLPVQKQPMSNLATNPKSSEFLVNYQVVSSADRGRSWAAARAAKSAGPAAPGSKAVPTPLSDDCLEGLAFVFTGELSAFSREEATELAKRYGGYVSCSCWGGRGADV